MKDSGQRRAWNDIRRSVFSPEPSAESEEHWIEVKRESELMCDTCQGLMWTDPRFDTITENLWKFVSFRGYNLALVRLDLH